MRDDISTELLVNIAINLSQQDLFACSRVCRLWNIAFTPTLYKSVNFQTNKQFKRFLNTLRCTEESNPLGHLVRRLNLPYHAIHGSISTLPRLCPFVVELDMKKVWYPELEEVLQKWKYITKVPRVIIRNKPPTFSLDFFGTRIQRLEIHISGYPQWIELMTEVPCVEELAIDGTARNGEVRNVKISLSDLEKVHKALPCLHILDMSDFSLCGEMPKHIVPCDTVHELRLWLDGGDQWGTYFAQKYRNLEDLSLHHQRGTAAIAEARILARSCQRLKCFYTTSRRLYRECLDILGEIGAPLCRTRHSMQKIS